MIRVHKSTSIPVPLRGPTSSGGKATTKLIAAYDAGERSFEFSSKIYGHPKVRAALIADQRGKCVFCEAKVTHTQYGDVEHFRPKGGYQQSLDDDLIQPGYYWLAYEWSNLTLSCQLCNQAFKRNHFPLFDVTKRAKSHRDKITGETPILVNPVAEDPEPLIGFRDEVAFGIDGEGRGETTIETVGLNQSNRMESRREALMELREAWRLLTTAEELARDLSIAEREALKLNESRKRLIQRGDVAKQYSAMFRSELRRLGVPI